VADTIAKTTQENTPNPQPPRPEQMRPEERAEEIYNIGKSVQRLRSEYIARLLNSQKAS